MFASPVKSVKINGLMNMFVDSQAPGFECWQKVQQHWEKLIQPHTAQIAEGHAYSQICRSELREILTTPVIKKAWKLLHAGRFK